MKKKLVIFALMATVLVGCAKTETYDTPILKDLGETSDESDDLTIKVDGAKHVIKSYNIIPTKHSIDVIIKYEPLEEEE